MTPDALTALCAATMPYERLTTEELTRICFGDGDQVVGDETGAAAFTMKQYGDYVAGWLLLVAVAPDVQGRGLGRSLVRSVAERAKHLGATGLHLANAIPRYIWPGVDLTNTRAGMLIETLGFERDLVGINMAIPTSFRREPPPGVVVERETSAGALEFAARAFPNWVEEVGHGIERGTTFAARSSDGTTIGFCCHSVNRRAWIGPMATDPTLQRGGVGAAVLAATCADLDDRGDPVGEIAWVSNLRFYGKCGATVSRVFQGGRLAL